MPRSRALLLASALLVAACGGEGAPAAGDDAGGPNLLLVVIDTLRADRLGCYGYEPARTPAIDGLAREGVLCERAFAHVPLTLPSHASLMTGTFPPEHGIHDNGRNGLGPELTTLAEVFRAGGWRTGAFIGGVALDSVFGLDRGFEVYDDDMGPAATPGVRQLTRRGGAVCDAALAWLKSVRGERFFCWVHLYDPHAAYEPPEGFRDFAHPYDGEVAYSDSLVGRLLGWLESEGLAEDTVVVLVSDHGEALGEHGESTHGALVYQGTQHVPLVLRAPGALPAGARVAAPVEQVDLMPTLLGLFDLKAPAQVHGRDLGAVLRGAAPAEHAPYFESEYCRLNFGWAGLHGLFDGRFKLIDGPRPELYDLDADPHERRDLAAERPELVERLRRRLDALRAGMRSYGAAEAEVDAELAGALEALGYARALGSGAEDPEAARRNPIDMIGVIEDFHAAIGAGNAGDFAAMLPHLERVVAACPESAGFRAVLGAAYDRVGRHEEGARELRAALERDPAHAAAHFYLARALRNLGDRDGAIESFRRAVELSPNHVAARTGLVLLLVEAGREGEALEQARELARWQPDDAVVRALLADLLSAAGHWAEAVAELERAVALAPEDPVQRNYLAWTLATAPAPEARDGARAVALAEELVAGTERKVPDRLDTLAAAYAEVGRFDDALRTLDEAIALERDGMEGSAAALLARRERYARGEPWRQD